MTSKKEWAERLAREGFFVFPLGDNDKAPRIKEWPRLATRDLAEVARWWDQWPEANVGIAPAPSGHAVIDVDVKTSNGEASLLDLVLEHGDLPATMETLTPTGGRHVWLALPGSCKTTAGKLGAGIDTRGRGGFVVGPGSTVAAGAYERRGGAPASISGAWEALLAGLGDEEAHREANVEGLDTPDAIATARLYLRNLVAQGDVAVEGAGGNDRTYRLAAALSDLGLSEDAAIAVAMEIWNDACRPPWDEEELATVFHNAYRYAQNESGSTGVGDGSDFAALPVSESAKEPAKRRARFKPLSIDEMRSLPEPAWLVPGWVPLYQTSLLYGEPGSMKSFAALDLALSVATGGLPWGVEGQGRPPRPVVYVAGEGQYGIARQRVPAWLESRMISAAPFFLVPEMPRADSAADLAELFTQIEHNCGDALPRLVVFDTHARLMSGLDENAAQDTAKALAFYDAVAARYSSAVLAVHHSGKGQGSARGSSALPAGVDTVLHMEYDRNARIALLSCQKQKDAPEPTPIALAPVPAGSSVILERRQATSHTTSDKGDSERVRDIVAVLKRNDATNAGRAMSTLSVASELPEVLEIEDAGERERARQSANGWIRRNLSRDLRGLVNNNGELQLPAAE